MIITHSLGTGFKMAIKPICDYCKEELIKLGAILLSPPDGHIVNKYHVCTACYEKIKPKYPTIRVSN